MKVPQMRPVSEMLNTAEFSMPPTSDMQQLVERVNTNLVYYQMNYVAVFAVCALFVCISRPPFFIAVLVVGALAVYLFSVRQTPIYVNGRALSRMEISMLFVAVSVLLLVGMGGVTFLVALAITLLFTLLHAAFRNRSLKSRATTFVDVMRGSTPLGAAMKAEAEGEEADDVEDPKAAEIRSQQAQFRSQFRTQMRQKYGLQKKN